MTTFIRAVGSNTGNSANWMIYMMHLSFKSPLWKLGLQGTRGGLSWQVAVLHHNTVGFGGWQVFWNVKPTNLSRRGTVKIFLLWLIICVLKWKGCGILSWNIYTLNVFVPLKLHVRYYWDANLVQIASMPSSESEVLPFCCVLALGIGRSWFLLTVSTEPATVLS